MRLQIIHSALLIYPGSGSTVTLEKLQGGLTESSSNNPITVSFNITIGYISVVEWTAYIKLLQIFNENV